MFFNNGSGFSCIIDLLWDSALQWTSTVMFYLVNTKSMMMKSDVTVSLLKYQKSSLITILCYIYYLLMGIIIIIRNNDEMIMMISNMITYFFIR